MADSGHSYSGTGHKLNVWALKWAERQETTHYCHSAEISEGPLSETEHLGLSAYSTEV
jgi:hypothetical protein